MLKYLYILWALLVFALVFLNDGLSLDNLTHIGILLFFVATLLLHLVFQRKKVIKNTKYLFIGKAVGFAAIVEGFYMISKPVFSSLQFVAGMSVGQMLHNYFIDLVFTLPAYAVIFYVIWWLINKYEYSLWQFIILFALGQALGDGSRTFLSNPGLILLIPYIMINYHAMNLVPFLKIRDKLPTGRSRSVLRFAAPLIFIPATYIVCGTIIYTIGGFFGLK